jgi:hypothetical protein
VHDASTALLGQRYRPSCSFAEMRRLLPPPAPLARPLAVPRSPILGPIGTCVIAVRGAPAWDVFRAMRALPLASRRVACIGFIMTLCRRGTCSQHANQENNRQTHQNFHRNVTRRYQRRAWSSRMHVERMVRRLLLRVLIARPDAADALALVICHPHRRETKVAWTAHERKRRPRNLC